MRKQDGNKEHLHEDHKYMQEMFIQDNTPLANLSSLVANSHDWKNIQEVVRIAFKYVTDSFCMQEDQLKFVISELQSKASKNELDTKLSNKPSHSEMNLMFQDCVAKLDSKLDAGDTVLTCKTF